jgi:hypothetical protein
MDNPPTYLQNSRKAVFFDNLQKSYLALTVVGLVTLLFPLYGCFDLSHVKQLFKPTGDKMVSNPEKTQEKYSCISGKKDILQLEDLQIQPRIVSPGREINHRIQYAFCPISNNETAKGNIIRIVRTKQQELFRDVEDYEFKAGTWIVDAFIGIPNGTRDGMYTVETIVKYKKISIDATRSFIVRNN